MTVAVSRVAPALLPLNSDDPSGLTTDIDVNSIGHILERIAILVRAVDREGTYSLKLGCDRWLTYII